jgi:hypothetical protein
VVRPRAPGRSGAGERLKCFTALRDSPARTDNRPNGSEAVKEILTPRDWTYMTTFICTKIELWPVEKLNPYDRNARTHSDEQIEQIARSIQEFGFTNPILVDTDKGPATPPRLR